MRTNRAKNNINQKANQPKIIQGSFKKGWND